MYCKLQKFQQNMQCSFWDMKVWKIELQYVNAHLLLNKLQLPPIRGSGGKMTPRNEKVYI